MELVYNSDNGNSRTKRKSGDIMIHTWTKIKDKLENDYLADSLKKRIKYFATSYSKCPDHEGRAAIVLDGKQVIAGSYCEQWSKAPLLPRDDTLERRLHYEFPFMDNTALKYSQFDQRCFYQAFYEFDNQSIDKSLASDNLLVRIFAILDRRVGKRTLYKLKENIESEPEIFQLFYNIRIEAEGIH